MARFFGRRFMALCLSAALFAMFGVTSVAAQDHLAVELTHPVYGVIETAELRGVLSRLSSVKPYTRAQVADFLATIQAHMDAFSPSERGMIAAFASEFASGSFGGAPIWKSENGAAAVGATVEATFRTAPDGLIGLVDGSGSVALKDLWHLNSRLVPYLAGAITPWLSVKGEAGFTIDKIERDLYLPYDFTKEWDTNHIDFSDTRYSLGEKDYPSFSYDIRQDIAAETDSGSLMVRLSRFRRDWGMGSGSFALSGTARPFVGLEVSFRPSKYFAVSSLVGSLTNWEKGGDEKSLAMSDVNGDGVKEYSAISWQKMLGLQRMELFPFDWLTVSATSTLIGAKRFELGYFSPLLFSVMYQNQLADIDNLGVQVDGSVRIPRVGKFYGSFYVDEMEITHLDELFTKARNMFALQGGAKIPLPGLPFFTLTAQYSKIEPFVYAHYPTWYPDYRLRVDTSYTQDGENLGYYLPPNSDEFLLRLEAMPAAGWRASLQYSFVRHGDYGGDVATWMDYSLGVDTYLKNFLHDGIYDYNHIAKAKLYWRPAAAPKVFGAALPLELGIGYGLSYTWYEDGTGGGAPVSSPEWRNVLELSCKLFL
ncbi:MAG: hypothetical protein ACYC1A_00945 [Spirochaetales bacterium]